MRFRQIGGKADAITVSVRNAETSSIPQGTPLVLALNGVDDGLAVVLPSSAGAAKTNALIYCITPVAIAANEIVDAFVYGYVPYTRVLTATRAASTDSWSSSASLNSLGVLVVDTINDALSLFSESQADGDFLPPFVLGQTVAAVAASASATSDTRTAIVTTKRVFVRLL